ncbi:outer membrane scaffolding protein for murein synthesis (MipA/OmpV family) [Pantoea sp. PNA 14-12]|uniref:MipA n=2 Tax=Pseudomonadota TaxID=1224 RepID=A0AB34VM34_9GAMM|nr:MULTISPECIES: MipA/OmpV family protein [Pantoea]KKW49726.1 MipA [Pantoea ananatis]KGD85419.1 MipA [Pantoea stewartii subsp. indologenes]KHE02532.1 MipA [Pantoea stewartii]KHN63862.1 MipA [Pantoea stewartii]KTS75903.1 MipA [Pantoea stewartii]
MTTIPLRFRTALCCLLLGNITHAWAEGLTLGAQGEANFTPYRAYKTQFSGLPYVGYDNDHVYIDGTEVGAYFIKDDTTQLKARWWYLDNEFDPDQTSDSALRQLRIRHSTMMGGMSYQKITPLGAFRTELSGDTLNESRGWLGTVAWAGQVSLMQLDVYPQAGVDWLSKQQASYYYGVSEEESARSGLPTWNHQGVTPWLAVAFDWHPVKSFHVYLQPKVTFLTGALRDSPMTDQQYFWTLSSGVTWTF